jgi:hypothetical protein
MGTKLKPASFDCHADALIDEPLFTLLARDPLAPGLVAIWAAIRIGDWPGAERQLAELINANVLAYAMRPEFAKAEEAMICALDMKDWRASNDGAWRDARQAPPLWVGVYPAEPPMSGPVWCGLDLAAGEEQR